jgi:hypothetical protein
LQIPGYPDCQTRTAVGLNSRRDSDRGSARDRGSLGWSYPLWVGATASSFPIQHQATARMLRSRSASLARTRRADKFDPCRPPRSLPKTPSAPSLSSIVAHIVYVTCLVLVLCCMCPDTRLGFVTADVVRGYLSLCTTRGPPTVVPQLVSPAELAARSEGCACPRRCLKLHLAARTKVCECAASLWDWCWRYGRKLLLGAESNSKGRASERFRLNFVGAQSDVLPALLLCERMRKADVSLRQ